MQSMMQTMHIHYNSVPHGKRQDYGALQDYGGRGYHRNQSSYRSRGGCRAQKIVIGAGAGVVEPTVILHITVGHTECVPIRANNKVPHHMATKRKQYGVTICRVVRETAPDRSGQYLLIKLI